MRARRVAVLTMVGAITVLVIASPTVAASNKYLWEYSLKTCYHEGIGAAAKMTEQGLTGTTWMRITARMQRYIGGSWQTWYAKYAQSPSQFRDNYKTHSLSDTFQFIDSGYQVRILFRYDWFHGSTRIESHTLRTGTCLPLV